MPTIRLKNNSAEYEDEDTKKKSAPCCDMPGCQNDAEHRAPKDRYLSGYYNFCLEHAKEYNKAWDYFSGMSRGEIEDHIFNSLYGDRPTWKYSSFKDFEESLHEKVRQTYYYGDEKQNSQSYESGDRNHMYMDRNSQEYEAMLIMGLEPPLSLDKIKSRYKELAKKYHPDLNQNDKQAEELLKSINMAYTILKLAYEKFSKLEQKSDVED